MPPATRAPERISQTRKQRNAPPPLPAGRARVVIERVAPCIDCGRFPAKRAVGEAVDVQADIFADGHDAIAALLRYRHEGEDAWSEARMTPLVNDRWRGTFACERVGFYEFQIAAWVDHFGTWQRDLRKRHEAGQDLSAELLAGAALLRDAAQAAEGRDHGELRLRAEILSSNEAIEDRVAAAMDERITHVMFHFAPRPHVTDSGRPMRVRVDREMARFSAWYELFSRSASPDPKRHGTFQDVEARLPDIAGMGFDVLYLPPIHPIGCAFRKGPNNTLRAAPEDPGSPWAIGSADGGHKSIHPDLGTLVDFRRLVRSAEEHGLEIALDIAFQCSPDHPYVKEHPEWFKHRPDGTIQYAENPPKKYQDIYPFDFETEAWESLWIELRSVIEHWIEHGVHIFRVDNPHTKAFPFWEWVIADIQREAPDVIFLSEAFTRPKVMYRLAKLGFTQSYTYFAWRNQPWEIEQYFTELMQTEVAEFFRPNAWPNTPDILTEYLQTGGRPASIIRLILAATLCANYGIYGPPFELVEVTPRESRSEEYLDSEKYQRRVWNLDQPHSLRDLITRLNRIRRQNPALQHDRTLRFHRCDNPHIICYSKRSADGANAVVCAVNTNPFHREQGTVHLDLRVLGIEGDEPYQMHDLLTDARYLWRGSANYVILDPAAQPAHVLRLRRHQRTEHDFDYFL